MTVKPMTRRRQALLTLAVLAAFASVPAFGADSPADTSPITIARAWSRATPPGLPVGAGYLTLRNAGKDADQLLSVSSPAAGEVQVHQSLMVDGEAQMREQKGLNVPAGGSVVLEPGGYHLMMMDLKAPLVVGQRVPVTLEFAKAGPVTTELLVVRPGAPGPDAD